jgi:hypothetical protein
MRINHEQHEKARKEGKLMEQRIVIIGEVGVAVDFVATLRAALGFDDVIIVDDVDTADDYLVALIGDEAEVVAGVQAALERCREQPEEYLTPMEIHDMCFDAPDPTEDYYFEPYGYPEKIGWNEGERKIRTDTDKNGQTWTQRNIPRRVWSDNIGVRNFRKIRD